MFISILLTAFVSAAYMPLQNMQRILYLIEEGTFGSFEDAKRIYIDYQQRIFVTDVHTHQVLHVHSAAGRTSDDRRIRLVAYEF